MINPYLNYSCTGEGFPLLVIHGLFGSSRNWQSLSRLFSRQYQVVTVDLRNHGDSFHDSDMDYALMSGDIIELMDKLALNSAHILGHSMGGKVAMQLIHDYPERVNKLVVADIAPVTYSHSYEDLINAVMDLDLSAVTSRKVADIELAKGIPDQSIRLFIMQNLVIQNGQAVWKLNWSALRQNINTITGFQSIEDWQIHNPVMFMRGEESPYITPENWTLIQQHFSDAQLFTLQNAGHWLHAEQPAAFADAVLQFLQP